MILKGSIQQAYDTLANWTAWNGILLPGQESTVSNAIGDAVRKKIGDGITTWNSLPYYNPASSSQSLLQTLGFGNSTSGKNIILSNGDLLRSNANNVNLSFGGSGIGEFADLITASGAEVYVENGYGVYLSQDSSGLRTIDMTATGIGITHNGNVAFSLGGDMSLIGGFKLLSQNASTVPVIDSNKRLISSGVSQTTLTYLDATSSIQTQLNTLTSSLSNYLPLAGGTMTGFFDLAGDATTANQAITYSQFNNALQGLKWKKNVKAKSTNNRTLSGTQSIDAVVCGAGDDVLLNDQTDPKENGIWTVASGAWSRRNDADLGSEILASTVYVELGSANGGTQWTNSNTSAITIGVTNITFAKIAGAGVYTNGTYLKLTGNVFDVDFTTFSTAQITEGSNLYYTNARGIGSTLTGYTSGAGTVSSADSILQAIQKLNGNMASYAPLASPTFTTKITSPEIDVSGTAGAGFINFVAQSANASAPSASGFNLFAGSTGSFNWARKNGTDTFVRTFDATLTADRTFTLQDASSTLAMYSNKLSVFAATTSAELAGIISDEVGTGKLVFNDSPSFTTTLTASYATASTIAGFDASKNLISLATATYPSLTELANVKGTTSAIQTQLDAKYMRVSCAHGSTVQFTSGSTLYWSTWHFGSSILRSVAGQALASLPVSATLVAAVITTWTATSSTSQTTSTVNFRYNGSDNVVSSSVLWSASAATPVQQVVTGLNVAVASGIGWEIKLVMGALGTAPTNAAQCTVDLYFKL